MVFHNGQIYRTVTKARWAVFFDYLKVPYEYEKETFKLDKELYYLPDFWLPEQDVLIDIKEGLPEEEDRYKMVKLHAATGKKVYIFAGFPEVLSFSDPFESNSYVNEICNFGTYVVDEINPGSCVSFPTKTDNIAMMHVLGLNNSNMQVHEYHFLTDRFNKAAIRGKEETFVWIG